MLMLDKQACQKSLVHGLIAFLLLGPMTGLVLDGFNIETHWQRPCYLSIFITVLSFFMQILSKKNKIRNFFGKTSHSDQQPQVVSDKPLSSKYSIFASIIVILIPFIIYKTIGNYGLSIIIMALIYVLLGLGLNIVVGMAGLLDLGFVAFYAVGAYTFALGSEYLNLGFWAALPLGAILAATFGFLLAFPVLKMHGDYLAIVTLGFGEIIRLVLNNWTTFTHGPNGLSVKKPTFFGLEFAKKSINNSTTFHDFFNISYSSSHAYFFMYFVCLGFAILAVLLLNRLKKMPLGRAWEALREDEIACRSLGINPVTIKLSAFSMSAFIGGLGGVLFAGHQNFVNPSSFTFIESAIILAIVVLGGMGSTRGVVIAALAFTLLPELLREFSDYRMLTFGILMVMMMLWRPNGLVRLTRLKLSRPKA
jgi:branched-chain amino acid transport system permease protein